MKPDADKIRRANAWSPMVEDGTILFRDRESPLCKAMLAVPGEDQAWNLVDAGGHCFRGFPRLQPLSERIPGMEPEPVTHAASYATKLAEGRRPMAQPARSLSKPTALKRAIGYAVRHAPQLKGNELGGDAERDDRRSPGRRASSRHGLAEGAMIVGGTAWETTSSRAVQRAAWGALLAIDPQREDGTC